MEKEKSIDVPPIEFIPDGEGMLVPATPAQPLTAAQHARTMTAARVILHAIDADSDGVITEPDVAEIMHTPMAAILVETRQELKNYNAQVLPWLSQQSTMLPNIVLFSREQLVDALATNEQLQGLSPKDLDQAITDALPGGVKTITLADECRTHRELPCLPVGERVLVHLSGPAI